MRTFRHLLTLLVLTAAAGCAATSDVMTGDAKTGGQAPSQYPNLAALDLQRPKGLMSVRTKDEELARLEALRARHAAAAEREIEKRD